MARRNRNLAGLAALGALGLYAARGSKKTDAEAAATPVEDRGPMVRPAAAVAASTEADRPDDRDIGMISGASPSGLYRDTEETGQLFSMNRPEAAPTRTPARPASGRMPSADEDFPPASRSKSPRRNVAGDYTRKMGATAEEIAAYNRSRQTPNQVAAEQPAAETSGSPAEKAKRMLPRPNTTYTHQLEAVRARKAAERAAAEQAGMKKGGAVKKMASGGMTASKRADGIASRGKTKCKMY